MKLDVEIIDNDVLTIDELENEFNIIIKEAEVTNKGVNDQMKMDELNEIGDSVIKAKQYLAEFAATGISKTPREMAYEHLSSLPLIGGWAKSKVNEVQETNLKNSGVTDVLESIFTSFEQKKGRLIELTDIAENMQKNLNEQRIKLGEYIVKLDKIVQNPGSSSDRMRAVDMSNRAMEQQETTADMCDNQIALILEMMGTLYQKLSKTLPVIKNTLNNSLTIAGTINSMRDSITMMNSLEDLSNEIQQTSSNNIQNLIIESTQMLTNGTDIEYFKNSAKRNEQYHETLIKVRKEYFEKTIEKYDQFKEIQENNSNLLERRVSEEAKLLENSIKKMKGE